MKTFYCTYEDSSSASLYIKDWDTSNINSEYKDKIYESIWLKASTLDVKKYMNNLESKVCVRSPLNRSFPSKSFRHSCQNKHIRAEHVRIYICIILTKIKIIDIIQICKWKWNWVKRSKLRGWYNFSGIKSSSRICERLCVFLLKK